MNKDEIVWIKAVLKRIFDSPDNLVKYPDNFTQNEVDRWTVEWQLKSYKDVYKK